MILETTTKDRFTLALITEKEASLSNADEFRKEIEALIEGGNKHIIVDFERVVYVDSSFLGSMVSALKHALAAQSEIYIVHLRQDIYDLLSLIRMNKVFKIFDTPQDAIDHLK